MSNRKLNPDQIIYLVAYGNYSRVFLADGTKEVFSTTLKEYALRWPPFIRISNQYLVNPDYVTGHDWNGLTTQRNQFGHVIMADGQKLPMSRRRLRQAIQKLTDHQSKKL